jgi:hypothetical protein
MFKPAPDEDAKVKVSTALSAITGIPFTDIVTNEFCAVMDVKYPASLFNWEILLPETITFFHVAILYKKC